MKPTDEMIDLFKLNHDPANELESPDLIAGLTAVLAVAKRQIRVTIAADIRAALAADEADSDTTSGEAIWEQAGYRRGLADAARLTAEDAQP